MTPKDTTWRWRCFCTDIRKWVTFQEFSSDKRVRPQTPDPGEAGTPASFLMSPPPRSGSLLRHARVQIGNMTSADECQGATGLAGPGRVGTVGLGVLLLFVAWMKTTQMKVGKKRETQILQSWVPYVGRVHAASSTHLPLHSVRVCSRRGVAWRGHPTLGQLIAWEMLGGKTS